MSLDLYKNGSRSTLLSGISDTDNTLTVAVGTGSKFPTAPFNCIVWNNTDFPDPLNDANYEIVRVTNVTGDVLTITRAQESTVAATHNIAGKTYGVAATLTAKLFNTDLYNTFEPTITAGLSSQYYRGDKTFQTLDNSAVGLSNVQNIALSSWTGTTTISAVGTILSGTWHGTPIADTYVASASTWNAKANAFTVGNSLTLSVSVLDTIQDIRTIATPQFTRLGIGTPANSAVPLVVGSYGAVNSLNPAIVISRDISGAGSYPLDDAHAFSDSSNFRMTGGVAYNSFDARITLSGTGDFNHYAGFQAIPEFFSTGTTTDLYGYSSGAIINSGTITNVKHHSVTDCSGAGTVTNQYGLYIPTLTKGVKNYGLFVSSNISRIDGQIGINTDPVLSSHIIDMQVDTSTTKVFMGMGALSGTDPTLYLQSVSGINVGVHSRNGHDFNIQSNNTTIMTATSAGNFTFLNNLSAVNGYFNGSNSEVRVASPNANRTWFTASNPSSITELGYEVNADGQNWGSSLAFASVLGSRSNTALQFATNGIVRTTILANGNMGINMTAPTHSLDVFGNTGSTVLGVGGMGDSTKPTVYLVADVDNSLVYLSSRYNFPLTINTNDTERMRITTSGSVSIATPTAVTNALVVNAHANAVAGAFIGSTTTGQSYGLYLQAGSNSSDYCAQFTDKSGTLLSQFAGDGTFYVANKVGIGDISPSDKLVVKAGTTQIFKFGTTSGFTYPTDFTGTAAILSISRPSDGGMTQGIFSYAGTGGNDNLGFGSRSDIVFCTGNAGLGAQPEVMRLKEGGAVILASSIQTGNPTGGTAQPWKFGSVAADVANVDINGTGYYLATQKAGPFLFKVKSITVNTAGSPSDIGTITIPSWLARYTLCSGTGPGGAGAVYVVAETAAGTMAAAAFNLRDAASGTGNLLSTVAAGPTVAGGLIVSPAVAPVVAISASTLYINQTANSANAGTISVYVLVTPLL